jgi:hypothetical protein
VINIKKRGAKNNRPGRGECRYNFSRKRKGNYGGLKNYEL